MRSLAGLAVSQWALTQRDALWVDAIGRNHSKAIVPTCGDLGRAEGLSNEKVASIPHHSQELLPQGTFLDSGRDEDVISH
jgi:hypothetical protein